MGERANWTLAAVGAEVTKAVGIDTPNPARVYNHWLGGANNFACDREFGDKLAEFAPVREFARDNQAFIGRAVRYLSCEGIQQFLVVGSGVPTVGNVHEVAQAASPDSRVVYVECAPIAVGLWAEVLARNELATIVVCDPLNPAAVVKDSDTKRLLDFSRPVAVLMTGLVHFIPDDTDPLRIIAGYRAAMCPGSYLVLSHVTADDCPVELGLAADAFKETNISLTPRTYDQVARLFTGFALVKPGVVRAAEWRPDYWGYTEDRRSICYGGVAAQRACDA